MAACILRAWSFERSALFIAVFSHGWDTPKRLAARTAAVRIPGFADHQAIGDVFWNVVEHRSAPPMVGS